jgi:hypothetical protein
MRNLIALLASLSPLAVVAAGSAALAMAVVAHDWFRGCMVVLVVCTYLLLFDLDLRRRY